MTPSEHLIVNICEAHKQQVNPLNRAYSVKKAYQFSGGSKNFLNLSDLSFVFEVYRCIEVRNALVGRFAHHLALTSMHEQAKF